jgi:hypothetical protein
MSPVPCSDADVLPNRLWWAARGQRDRPYTPEQREAIRVLFAEHIERLFDRWREHPCRPLRTEPPWPFC